MYENLFRYLFEELQAFIYRLSSPNLRFELLNAE